ncbi:MAG: metal-sensitive transcriptional regulator [Deltaproteobacteria bacterium]|nr:metal-sensitive transcriptional regulator [Deltaproteobacteria bacterium]MBI4795576.1 metal-sensitive transcriptional regulator [Deltaproteobacteria bacterium]
MYPSDELKKQMQRDIHSRLKKIEGQIRGLQGMIDADKDCEQILTQARAAHSALKAVCNRILKVYLVKCYGEGSEEQNAGGVFIRLDKAIDMFSKFID